MTLPRPPMPPLPPPDGAFRQVRRRALLRRLRGPSAVVAVVALAAVSFGVTRPHPTAGLQPVSTPSATETTYSPEPTPTSVSESPTPSPVPTLAVTVAPQPTTPPTATPTTPLTHGTLCTPDMTSHSAGPDITGTVVDRAGQPVPNISIWTDTCDKGLVSAATTDAHGRFSVICTLTFVVVAPFAWDAEVRSVPAGVGFAFLDHGFWRGTDPVPCGSTHHVVLPRAATIRAHLTDRYGNGVPPVGNRWVDVFYEQEDANGIQHCKWDATGTCVLAGLAPGRYELYDPPATKRVWVTVTEGQTVDVDVPTGTSTQSPTPSPTPSGSGTPTSFVAP